MQKLHLILLSSVSAALLVIGAGCTQVSANVTVPTTVTAQPTNAVKVADNQYTMEQVRTANSVAKCWTIVNGNVYDLTSWINQHPGGQGTILSMCGTDGSAAFDGRHGGQRRPESELAGFKIGTLKK